MNFAVTSNHVHLLVTADGAKSVAPFMQCVQGEFAADFNRRNERSGAFWSDRYHATMIDDGEHLLACMRYIDLNMVRAGVVAHPQRWDWCGWHELTGARNPPALINLISLLRRLNHQPLHKFRDHYRAYVEEAIARPEAVGPEPRWSTAIAIGTQAFISTIESALDMSDRRNRMTRDPAGKDRWVLRDTSCEYGSPQHEYILNPAQKA